MLLKDLVHRILAQATDTSFRVVYWDSDVVHYGPAGDEEFAIVLKHERGARNLLDNVKLRLGEAYVAGDVEIEGDLQRFVRLAHVIDVDSIPLSLQEKLSVAAMALCQRNSVWMSKQNIKHHYEIGNDFYQLWLDGDLVYSCGYFHRTDDDLDRAQAQKLSHLCTKLRLAPGERLLDVGCGWGGLAMYAAQHHEVEATGITLSEQQCMEAARRVAQRQLAGRVDIRVQDYRHLRPKTPFDKWVSVGMFEHVGKAFINEYVRCITHQLRRGGLGVLHTMGRMAEGKMSPWINKYIFPGLYLPSLAEISDSLGRHGFNIVDVENLRMHYGFTLDRWAERFERNVDVVQEMFDEKFVRMWRLYLHSCAAAFKYGYANLWQITFTNGLVNDLPLTREHLYSSDRGPGRH
jgi:cyclopropane-fatty-acyl-phospholipid synthase